ncbi:hypothetical protein [Aquabacterium parvum]|jgi:peptidoglycan/LPS O-acetylase OafA/YrhL|uniref:hypothetical protein n=1 Tax=Aquabacterium parvum TaxID=70584 RepID=UPI001365B7E1|nr:hypothetical protein [Aquabacterium parvum]MBU0915871.1 hypothetical protein [Gammaproteobacteria bacterium]
MQHRIDQLQLIRLLAAMLVLIGHARDKVAAGIDTLGGRRTSMPAVWMCFSC